MARCTAANAYNRRTAMLIDFFLKLKSHKLPVSIKEYLTLLEAMGKDVISPSIDEFYYLSRAALVKDEANFDKFDRAFSEFWHGVETIPGIEAQVPLEWLLKQVELHLSEDEKKQIEALGGWEKLMKTLKKRLEEQKGQHQGGNKWIGTGGTSPFGAYGYNPEGIRIGQHESRHRRAVKVWDQREFKNIDDSVEIGTRNIKVALRRLRKVARVEFKHLEYFYFHNFLYERVWKDNRRRSAERMSMWDVLHTYPHDYKVIVVGDATMSPYEITYPGGSVEHTNEEPGAVWLQRMLNVYHQAIWLNPQPESLWDYHDSIRITRELMGERMFPLTLEGLDRGMRLLGKAH